MMDDIRNEPGVGDCFRLPNGRTTTVAAVEPDFVTAHDSGNNRTLRIPRDADDADGVPTTSWEWYVDYWSEYGAIPCAD